MIVMSCSVMQRSVTKVMKVVEEEKEEYTGVQREKKPQQCYWI